MKAIDWTDLFKRYKGLWVALKDDEITVIAAGKSLEKVYKMAIKKGFPNPIFWKVPSSLMPMIG